MKKEYLILIAAAVLVGIALFVFMRDDDPDPVPVEELSADARQGLMLLKQVQDSCLSNESSSAGVTLDLDTDFLSKFNAASGVQKDKSLGAVNYVDEQLRSVQDDKIRECIQEHMPEIKSCLMGDCQAALAPKEVDFQFTYEMTAENLNLDPNHVAFGVQNRTDNQVLFLQPGRGYYIETLPLLPRNKVLNASIYSVVRESYMPNLDERIQLCLTRADPVPSEGRSTRYRCRQGNGCEWDDATPHFFESCPSPVIGARPSGFSLIASAWANAEADYWAIPTLEVLAGREDLFGIGYTRFRVEALAPMNTDYDGYTFDLSVNGRPARINGLPGNYQARSHDFSQPVAIEFGLQNLNFTGADNGCDQIELTLGFVKEGEEVGEPVTLQRSYVALRDARDAEISAGGIDYRWTGKYQRAPRMYDTEVFISSLLVSRELDLEGNAEGIRRAKESISDMKHKFDALGLEFNERPLVAVIRPPLTQVSYGLAIGMVEPTQQVRFTYYNPTARELQDFLLAQRDRGPEYRSVIREDIFRYSVRGTEDYMQSPPVCS